MVLGAREPEDEDGVKGESEWRWAKLALQSRVWFTWAGGLKGRMGVGEERGEWRMQKRQIGDLALFGGEPLFSETRHVGRPNIGDRARFLQRANEMFDRLWLTNNGPYVVEFERRIEELCETPHCVALCNATIGLELLIRTLDLSGEVIVPSFTFVATVHALQWLGLTPVFCDVDPITHTIDPARVEELITPRTTAIFGVHVWGRSCDVEALQEIADRHDLRLVFDAAHAFASSHRGRMIGSFGDAEVFSFHATKFLNTFEGGAITTRDPGLAERLRSARNFGFSGLDLVTSAGTNAKMTEISAAMGLTSLESIDDFIAVNRENYHAYRRALAGIPGMSVYELPQDEHVNFQYVVVQINEKDAGISRDEVVDILISERIMARRYFYPGVHNMQPYGSMSPSYSGRLPHTERLTKSVLQLPTGTAMTVADVEDIGALLHFISEHSAEISARMMITHLAS